MLKSVAHCTAEDIDFIFSINAKGTILCSREACKVMEEKGGSIINLDSVAGVLDSVVLLMHLAKELFYL